MLDLILSFFTVYPLPTTFAEVLPWMAILFIELMLVLAVFRMIGNIVTSAFQIGRLRT